jgi:hypothetical protein
MRRTCFVRGLWLGCSCCVPFACSAARAHVCVSALVLGSRQSPGRIVGCVCEKLGPFLLAVVDPHSHTLSV